MNSSRETRWVALLKYLAVFAVGIVFGLQLSTQLYMRNLSASIEDQSEDKAQTASLHAAYLATELSRLRMNERPQAIQGLEVMLDSQIDIAGIWLENVQDAKTTSAVKQQLGAVKWYRDVVPPQPKSKAAVDKVLAQVPALPEPSQNPHHHLSALARFHRRYHGKTINPSAL